MNLYPAIDLRGGMCVRLEKGNFSKETVYSKDPGAMARRFAEAGARTIHVVDLDGALAGKSENLSAIKAIYKASYTFRIVPPGYPNMVSTFCSRRHSIKIRAPVSFMSITSPYK